MGNGMYEHNRMKDGKTQFKSQIMVYAMIFMHIMSVNMIRFWSVNESSILNWWCRPVYVLITLL